MDKLTSDIYTDMIRHALAARNHAYAPYSDFLVGACVMTSDGNYYTGCNIENASYGATNCAERTAIFKAVSEGHTVIKAVAIIGGMRNEITDYTYPCGICRQVIAEFASKDCEIIAAKNTEDYKVFKLEEIIPHTFTL